VPLTLVVAVVDDAAVVSALEAVSSAAALALAVVVSARVDRL
jgi:hypothetical protein